jgi:hypothetical protein
VQALARAGLQYDVPWAPLARRHGGDFGCDGVLLGLLPFALDVGEGRIDHTIPFGNEHGEVRVTRDIPNRLTPCKELVFSVESGKAEEANQAWYTAQACRSGVRWKWALAEPATQRWDSLQ